MTITDYGQQAIASAMAGQTQITITDMKTSDSTFIVKQGDYWELSSVKQSVAPSSLTFDERTRTAIVSGLFRNTDLTTAYTIQAVGIYARCTGEYEMLEPKLFAYELLTPGDFMPLPSTAPTSWTYEFNTQISSGSAVNIIITEGSYALASDFESLQARVRSNECMFSIVRLNNTQSSAEMLGYEWMQEISTPGVTENHWATSWISAGSYNPPYGVETLENKIRLWFPTKPSTSTYLTLVYMPTND